MGNKKHYECPEFVETYTNFQDVLLGSQMAEPDPFGEGTIEGSL